MKNKLEILFVIIILVNSNLIQAQKHMKQNILLSDFKTPYQTVPFHEIKLEDYLPAFKILIEKTKKEIDKIANNKEIPTFENTIEALERTGKQLNIISNIFFNLNLANTNDKMEQLSQEIAPMLTNFSNDVYLNEKLFKRIDYVYKNADKNKLTEEQLMLLEKTYKSFVRRGSLLDNTKKEELRKITVELSKLSLKFQQNLLNETNKFILHITNKEDLSGLPEHIIALAEQEAKNRNLEGWVFTLHAPSYVPFMQYADNRKLREKIYKAYNSRCFHGDEYDNREIIRQIVNLRLQLANLLGYKNYAEYVLEERMAKTVDKVNEFLHQLYDASYPVAKKEYEEVLTFAKSIGFNDTFQKWDWAYYSEKLRKQKYDIDDEMTKPYFQLEKVQEAIFKLANVLYGINIKENNSIPVYHEDVKAFEVIDSNNRFLGILYLDYFPRAGKKGGAWATNFREQYKENGIDYRPHVSLVFNFTRPVKDVPSLLTYDQVTTFLHEFGHALHSLLTDCNYESLSGTNVYLDFVELPSQIMENCARKKEWLDQFAIHYKTGEKIPEELLNKIIESEKFLSGTAFLRQLSFGTIDMAWHTIETKYDDKIEEFERKVMKNFSFLPDVEECLMSPQFSHIFGGGYASGYYSYKWSEVLDADAFSLFEEEGIFNKTTAEKFRKYILSRGGTKHPMELYKEFRGREPSVEPLLIRSGLIQK